MSNTTLTLTPVTIVASVSNAAAATTRGAVDMRGKLGGLLTMKITNAGALGAQCEGRVLIAHTSGATPAAASAGADWKTLWRFGGGLASGTVTEQSMVVDPCNHLEVEFTGNTTNAATVEAYLTEYTNAATV